MNKTDWMKEKIPYIKSGNWIYNIVCFLCGKRKTKLSYQEMYLLLKQLNKKAIGLDAAKKQSMNKILEIYKYFHNNKLPNMVDNDE